MPFVKRKGRFPAAKVDLVLEDNGLFLMEYGIAGDIVDTTGHTYGSISVILESGEAFVGCLAQKGVPFGFRPKLPIYAKDIKLLKRAGAR